VAKNGDSQVAIDTQGEIPKSRTFSQPLISAVSEALGEVSIPAPRTEPKTARARFIWDEMDPFIGWRFPGDSKHLEKTWYLESDEGRRIVDVQALCGGGFGIPISPHDMLCRRITDGSISIELTPVESTRGILLFDGKSDELMSWSEAQDQGIDGGELLVVVSRDHKGPLSDVIGPSNSINVVEEGVPLPGSWRRRYRGYRVEIQSTGLDDLHVTLDQDQVIRIPIKEPSSDYHGSIVLESGGPTYLTAKHFALLGACLSNTVESTRIWADGSQLMKHEY
jgi:hypothetical protein